MSTDVTEWRVVEATHHPARQALLDILTRENPPVAVEPLAASFPASDLGVSDDSVVALLHHVHLPKLSDVGLLEYDETERQVTAVAEEAERVLDAYEQWVAAYRQPEAPDAEQPPAVHTHPSATDGAPKMTVIVDIDFPADQFVLGDIVSRDDEIQIELERIVPLDDAILPFLWVSSGSNDAVEALLRSSDYVRRVTRLVTLEDRALYQFEWTRDVNGIVAALEETAGVIMEGNGTSEKWSLRLRFTTHESFKAFADHCRSLGIDTTLCAVYNPHPPVAAEQLTTAQREALRVAADWGYFKVPREVSLKELAAHLGVSEQAVSQRLRRGLDNLVAGSFEI